MPSHADSSTVAARAADCSVVLSLTTQEIRDARLSIDMLAMLLQGGELPPNAFNDAGIMSAELVATIERARAKRRADTRHASMTSIEQGIPARLHALGFDVGDLADAVADIGDRLHRIALVSQEIRRDANGPSARAPHVT